MDRMRTLTPSPTPMVSHSHSRSLSRSVARIPDDLLSDLSPTTTLEAFTSPSSRLKESIEAAPASERAFSIRATLASKKIKEWVHELSAWPWPAGGGSAGFEVPEAKRRKLSQDEGIKSKMEGEESEHIGSLLAAQVTEYETRLEEIAADMDDLQVEEIKRQVLASTMNFTSPARSRVSSANFYGQTHIRTTESEQDHLTPASPYTAMDDLTAVVTATVLRALPNLSRLTRLMDVWSVRLTVLRKIPSLLKVMDDVELALASGWEIIKTSKQLAQQNRASDDTFTRQYFNAFRDALQGKVGFLGRELDFMLDTLEGWEDTLPDDWLSRMESIENSYGEWIAAADRTLREAEWRRNRQTELERLRTGQDVGREEEERIFENSEETEETRLAEAARGAEQIHITEESRRPEETRYVQENGIAEEARLPEISRSAESGIEGSSIELADPTEVVKLSEENSITEEGWEADQGRLAEEMTREEDTELVSKASHVMRHDEDTMEPTITAGTTDEQEPEEKIKDSKEMSTVEVNQEAVERPLEEAHIQRAEDTPTLEADQILETDSTSELALQMPDQPVEVVHGLNNVQIPSELQIEPEPPLSRGEEVSGNDNGTSDNSDIPNAPPRADFDWEESDYSDFDSQQEVLVAPEKQSLDESPASKPSLVDQAIDGEAEEQFLPSISQSAEDDIENPEKFLGDGLAEQDDEWLVIHSPDEEIPFSTDPIDRLDDVYNPPTPPVYNTEDTALISPTKSSSFAPPKSEVSGAGSDSLFDDISTSLRSSKSVLDGSFPNLPAPNEQESKEHDHRVQSSDQRAASLPPVDEETEHDESSTEGARNHIDTGTRFDGGTASPTQLDRSGPSPATSAPLAQMSPRVSHRGSISSNASTVIVGRPANIVISRRRASSPNNSPSSMQDRSPERESPIINEQSPLAGRVGTRSLVSHEYTPPGSPHVPAISPRKHLAIPEDDSRSESPESPAQSESSFDLPILPNVNVSSTSALPATTKATEDQMQQQISEILESIPARIRLRSDSETTQKDTLQPKKTRRPLTPSLRSHSSMSNSRSYSSMSNTRSVTPSFTLTPAYGKNPRPRPQNSGVSETRLYHLSRATGEAPIKLFVRLVGENGERVMVRVGGGWADFGEYLKEYAAHHRRRSSNADDKVEIQDMPSRNVSSGSMISTPNVRNGRASPASRPGSALERPTSSLSVRKTRRGEGESGRDVRSPSTPLVMSSRGERWSDTPPSAISTTSSSSRLSWTEEDSSLGLAGPKGKKVDISARDQEWVESMKDKVRKASAEKEKRHGNDFGVIGKVGGTKRLFRKG